MLPRTTVAVAAPSSPTTSTCSPCRSVQNQGAVLAGAGLPRIVAAAVVVVRGSLGEPPFAAFGLHDDRVVGAAAVESFTAARAARRMIDRAVAADPGRLADPATDLRKLLRG